MILPASYPIPTDGSAYWTKADQISSLVGGATASTPAGALEVAVIEMSQVFRLAVDENHKYYP